jgi:hypothetical protein
VELASKVVVTNTLWCEAHPGSHRQIARGDAQKALRLHHLRRKVALSWPCYEASRKACYGEIHVISCLTSEERKRVAEAMPHPSWLMRHTLAHFAQYSRRSLAPLEPRTPHGDLALSPQTRNRLITSPRNGPPD